jgi:glycerate 2-kinase
MVKILEENMMHFSAIIARDIGIDLSMMPGSGAAGGLGAGAVAFAGAQLAPGIEIMLNAVGFDSLLDGADYLFTGEGRLDIQSLSGKAVLGVAHRAARKNVPVIVIAGDIGDNIEGIYEHGVRAVFSINRNAINFQEARKRCETDLALTMDAIMRIIKF